MPVRQFIWHPDETEDEQMVTICSNGAFDVANLSSIRFPNSIVFEDIPILTPSRQCTVQLDVSDLDGNGLKINNSDDCVYVEGKRERFNGSDWVQNQVCRRLPLPLGFKVESVRSKVLSYGKLALTVNMRGIFESDVQTGPVTKIVLICTGVITSARTDTVPMQLKLSKIQPKIIQCAPREQLRQEMLDSIHPSDELEDDFEEPVGQNEEPNTSTGTKSRDSQVQVGASFCNPLYRGSCDDPIVNLHMSLALSPVLSLRSVHSDRAEVLRKYFHEASEDGEEYEESEDAQLEPSNNKCTTVNPKMIWDELTALGQEEVKIDLDWNEREQTRLLNCLRCVY